MHDEKMEFRVPHDLKDLAITRARQVGVKNSDFMRCALRDFLQRNNTPKKAQIACMRQRAAEGVV